LCVLQFQKLGGGSDGQNELDEFMSHKFLEDCGETMTVLQLRAKLAEIGLLMSPLIYFLFVSLLFLNLKLNFVSSLSPLFSENRS